MLARLNVLTRSEHCIFTSYVATEIMRLASVGLVVQCHLLIYSFSAHAQLDPASVWLQEEFGNRAYFPNTTGASFDLPSDIGLTAPSLVVQGQANQASSVAHIPTIATPGPSTCGPSSRPPFTARKSMPSVSVKVVQATMSRQASGKPSFNKLGQTYLDLTDATANVSYVKHMIRQRWGAEYTLVTLDGLELEDSSGTQG